MTASGPCVATHVPQEAVAQKSVAPAPVALVKSSPGGKSQKDSIARRAHSWASRIYDACVPKALRRPTALPPTVSNLQAQVQQACRQGIVHAQAAEIASRALSFGDVRVSTLMVPRNRVRALPVSADLTQLRRMLLEEGHSRVPVYDKTLDAIVGILVAKDVLALAWEQQLIVLQDLIQPPYFAPQSMHAADLMRELQRRRQHFAVVVDELGGTAGIITLEDLLEELVGEIFGEHDAKAPELIHREDDGSITVEGMMPVREANRELRLSLPEDESFTTVGGLCVSLAGRIPETGAKLLVNEVTTLEVIEASARQVVRVRLARTPKGHRTRLALNDGVRCAN